MKRNRLICFCHTCSILLIGGAVAEKTSLRTLSPSLIIFNKLYLSVPMLREIPICYAPVIHRLSFHLNLAPLQSPDSKPALPLLLYPALHTSGS